MARTPKDVTDAELAVLEVLWSRPESSAREIAAELHAGANNSQVASVQKLCERLEAKACVQRDSSRRPASYRAVVDRQQLIGRQLQQVADKLCSGSFAPLLTHLVESGSLSAADLDSLRRQVRSQDQEDGR